MLYDIAFILFAIIYLPTLIFRGKLHKDFLERFGKFSYEKLKALAAPGKSIWIQAVSVGEVSLCKRLVPLLRLKYPDDRIVFSTITKTGNDLAKKLFAKDAVIIYFPLDLSFIVRRVVGIINPKLYVMVETEIWPNVIKEVSGRNIPSIMINGRISDRSFGKYKLARRFLKSTLARISQFSMQSKTDAERITSLGAPTDAVCVTGNMKFDVDVLMGTESSHKLKELMALTDEDQLLVAGSTHKGEEEMLINAFKELIEEFPRLRFLIAPRHIERTGEVEHAIKEAGFASHRISELKWARNPIRVRSLGDDHGDDIFILDMIGQLNDAYDLASIVFVGGSLIRHGGQNPIEPAILEKPVLFGPHMFNFREITALLLERSAAVQVADAGSLTAGLRRLLDDPKLRSELGRNAKDVIFANRGATSRNLDAISGLLK